MINDILTEDFKQLKLISKNEIDIERIDIINSQDNLLLNNENTNKISENTPIIKPQINLNTGEIA